LSGARWDEARFLRPELAENRSLIERAQSVELHPGDALLFHCRTLHAAGRNETDQTKLSAVFTYYAGSNPPTAGTRSAQYAGIELPR
jgi:phytanoyl-CoA hydroxylase